MKQYYTASILVVLISLLAAPLALAADDEELDPIHHTADGYYLDFSPFGKVELPRIFLVRRADGSIGVDVYGSTAAALRSNQYVPEETEEVLEEAIAGAESDVVGLIESGAHLDAHLVPAQGSLIVDFSITRHLVFALLGGLIVLVIFTRLAARYKRGIGRETAPRGIFQNMFETLVLFIRDEVARPNLGDKYKIFLPYLLTAFFFILTCNLLGLVPFGATATSNLMITAVLATFTFILTQFHGSKDHWKHVFWPPGVPTAIKPILIPVEILGLFTKPIALAIRLFANMTAGHLVILSLIGLIFSFSSIFGTGVGYGVSPVSVAFALFISMLEILVAFIQAFIFTMLSALFIGMAVEEHHHDAHDDAHHAAGSGGMLHGHESAPLIIGDGAEQMSEAAPVPA